MQTCVDEVFAAHEFVDVLAVGRQVSDERGRAVELAEVNTVAGSGFSDVGCVLGVVSSSIAEFV